MNSKKKKHITERNVEKNNDYDNFSLNYLDKKYVWHPYTQMNIWNKENNKIIKRGHGFYLIDVNNSKILDGIANMWCSVWGYSYNPVIQKIQKQFQELPHSTLFGLGNKPSIKLAVKLVKLAKGMDKVFYSDNGSTAVEIAIKIAIQYWNNKGVNKNKLLSLQNGYHGDTIATMSIGYIDKYFSPYKPLLIKTLKTPAPSTFEKRLNDSMTEKEILDICIEKTEKILEKNSNIAAFIMESGAQIAGGISIYPKSYQKKISNLCRKYGVLLILDEIATGFGRLGNMIEYIYQESKPDIVCFGKALNGGYFPIAVTLTTNKIFNAFLGNFDENKQFFHGHTFTGHPVGCSACLENINMYERTNLINQIRENSKYIESRLKELSGFRFIHKIKHKGLLTGIELATEDKARRKYPLLYIDKIPLNQYVMNESLKRGIFLRTLGNIITLVPPLAIQQKDLSLLLDKNYELLKTIEQRIEN